MSRNFRFLVKESEVNAHVWEVYKCYGDDSRGEFVASVVDKETLELLISAPARRQLQENLHKSGVRSAVLLSPRSNTNRTLRDLTLAFIGYLRRL